jgi:hypothetical protein
MCKVRWSHHSEEEATWEREDDLMAKYREALNLGVEFFLLFTHQIQALLYFLFPFRSFFPIPKQYSDWCPYHV